MFGIVDENPKGISKNSILGYGVDNIVTKGTRESDMCERI